MPSEFSNARVDLGQERSPDRGEIVALVKGLCLKSGNFVEPKARPEDFVGRGATVWLERDFSFRTLLRYVGHLVIAATRARWL
jgi:hypothetical protein